MKHDRNNEEAKTLVIRLRDGQIIEDQEAVLHSDILVRWNLSPENVVDSGFKKGDKFYWQKKKTDHHA